MVKFGPSGNCISFYEAGHKSTLEAGKWLKEIGLDAYEYSFCRGVTVSDETAISIGKEMRENGITISAHAPYFINLANENDEMAEKSFLYITNSLYKLRLLGGKNLVVHPGSLMKLSRDKAIELTKKRLVQLKSILTETDNLDMKVCLETMGKFSQIGTYQEIVDFCQICDAYYPAFDFGHINCILQGGLKTKQDFLDIFNYAIKRLGYEKVKNCHIHFSKIQYGTKGEIKHLTLDDDIYGPEFEPLAEAIKELGLEPIIICESRDVMALDAIKLKNIYKNT